MEFGPDFGERIRARRKELGLKQGDVAPELGITVSAYSLWEHGKLHKPPSPAQVEKLVRILKLTREYLILGSAPGEALAARTEEERNLLLALRTLPPERRRLVTDLLKLISTSDIHGPENPENSRNRESSKSS
jgi:transcriptional regulator with XRE-family HTH domain